MLYIFDLGNVIVDIDFNRALGVWSHLSGTPLAVIAERFRMDGPFEQHERGEISDEAFAQALCDDMGIHLSFEQFSAGWQAIFIQPRAEVIKLMQRLRNDGHRVVVLSNTNALHSHYWLAQFPQIAQSADRIYCSQEIGMRKPEHRIYRYVLEQEGVEAQNAVFFDDNPENILGARAVGLVAVLVTDDNSVPHYFAAL